jgi:nucleoside-diphosphate-sugar epimerase
VSASRSGPLHVVVGASGQIGAHVVRTLEAADARVRLVARSPSAAPCLHEYAQGDIGDPADAERLCAGGDVIYACFGGPHATWSAQFPRMTEGVLAGARRAGAKVVFADNLYAYGPQHDTLTEETPVRPLGRKPRLRADIAARFLAAHRRGEVRVAIARASDLYGPGIQNAMVGASLVAAVLTGRKIYLLGDLDAPHTFSFVPDVARAMVQLGVSDDAWGEVWHLPSAPALSLRALVAKLADLGATKPRVARIPSLAVRVAGVFAPQLRELVELSFQWDRP